MISPAAAWAIVNELKIEGYFPSAFQARIAGAKGLWIVDPCGNPYLNNMNEHRITISPAQVKFKNHPEDRGSWGGYDPHRLTFEVVAHSKPLKPGILNLDLISILQTQGVPESAFTKLLTEYLSDRVNELESAVKDGCDFRKWIHDNYHSKAYDEADDTYKGSLPIRVFDKIILLLEVSPATRIYSIKAYILQGGFSVRDCWYLNDLAFKTLSSQYNRLEDRLSIPVGQSTIAYCVPDVTQTLEEGTVHFGFSGTFVDQKSNFHETMLINMDILVARSPAVRPYDIQKVCLFYCELVDVLY